MRIIFVDISMRSHRECNEQGDMGSQQLFDLENVPSVIFGTSGFGNLYRETTQSEKTEIVAKMVEHIPGKIAFDSAGKYGAGLALECLGKALSSLGVKREKVLISNKLGWKRVPLAGNEPTFEPGVWVGLENDAIQDISYDGIFRCWEEGNQFLASYDAQWLSVHDPDEYLSAASSEADRQRRWNDILGAYKALDELRVAGKTDAIGVGSKDWRLCKELVKHCDLDWIMIACCFTVYRHDRELLEFIAEVHERGIAVINSAVFHGGFMTGSDFFDYRLVSPESECDLFDWREQFHDICREFEIQPAQACVAFGVSPPGVVSVALNNSHPEFVEENARLAEEKLPNEFWMEMKKQNLIASDYPFLGHN